MKVLDPGHYYELTNLDGIPQTQTLRFVKREGQGYPGNTGHYPGTTMQEVLRAVVQRLEYTENQIPCEENQIAQKAIKEAIWALERRAAKRHKRSAPTLEEAVYGTPCSKCNHVGCKGECHDTKT